MKAISLFSGAGGMDVGFKQAGFTVIAANEIDTHACQTFRANHIETTLYEGDIANYTNELAHLTDIDVVFGGPPCQGFSVAGKMDITDPRSQLIFSFADVVEKVRPRAFVMENVKALGHLEKFALLRKQLIARFIKAGYTTILITLNAKDFGIPQSRERVFFIGLRQTTNPITVASFQKYYKTPPTLREVISPLGKAGTLNNRKTCKAKITLATKPVLRQSPYAGMLFNGQGRPLNPDGWASTLPASMGGNRTPIIDEAHLFHDAKPWVEEYHQHLMKGGKPYSSDAAPHSLRRLTVDEAALLQGFPLNYQFCGPQSKVFSQIGNAVPCKLAYVIADVVCQTLAYPDFSQNDEHSIGQNMELQFA
ncbi:DNA cytosine methyltransferase [Thiofilum flexile]|uniref:DNA cytosine methyltransferase n=1 Tax=Thiofilum flexile TaxID=125627 RepID=UPI000367C05F|nr:DNA cytosine methyltransferase [Thiofilum flexile]